MFNYSKLIGRIVERFQTRAKFGAAIGMTNATVSNKLLNKSTWTQQEILRACSALEIPDDEIVSYFFTV